MDGALLMAWSRSFERCQYPYCAHPNASHGARGYCRNCYAMLWRDANPPGRREKARARKRARLSWHRRRIKILDAERRARVAVLREHTWRLARALGGSGCR
jgi:hypothetical protein